MLLRTKGRIAANLPQQNECDNRDQNKGHCAQQQQHLLHDEAGKKMQWQEYDGSGDVATAVGVCITTMHGGCDQSEEGIVQYQGP